jgi:hypothetical protein
MRIFTIIFTISIGNGTHPPAEMIYGSFCTSYGDGEKKRKKTAAPKTIESFIAISTIFTNLIALIRKTCFNTKSDSEHEPFP